MLNFLIVLISLNLPFPFQSDEFDVSNYKIYYGRVNEYILSEMSKLDLVVVEGLYISEDQVKFLQSNDTKVIGYISFSEVGRWDDEMISMLTSDDYLKVDGKIIENGHNKIGDIRTSNFQRSLKRVIKNRIFSKNMDGIFIDTMSNYDKFKNDKNLYKELSDEYLDVLSSLKRRYPDKFIMQNRGFNMASTIYFQHLDAIVWENYYLSPFSKRILERFLLLEYANTVGGTKIFTISYSQPPEHVFLTQVFGWINLNHNSSTSHSEWED